MYRRAMGLVLGMLVATGFLTAQTYENSPDAVKVIPEAIWASATGGGTWQTEIQVMSRTNGTQVHGTFYHSGGVRAVNFSVTLDQWDTFKISNILQYMGNIDMGFDYYNKVGALVIYAQDNSHNLHVNARTWHSSGYAKSFNGMTIINGQTINSTLRWGEILNLSQNSSNRSSMACFNIGSSSITVDFYIMNNSGYSLGSFRKTFAANEFQAFNPYTEAGLTAETYSNNYVHMAQQSGSGNLFVIGASAINYTNDPSAHTFLPYIE